MSIYINLSQLGARGGLSIPRPAVNPRVEEFSPRVNPSSGVTVSISDGAQHLATAESNPFSAEVAARGTNAFIDPDTDLRELLKQYDFRSITPRQLMHLGNELFNRGEISEEANGHFSVANDLHEPMQPYKPIKMHPDKPIDVISHFEKMRGAIEEAARTNSGNYDYGIASMKHFTQTFDDIRSFVESDRKEISTHQGVTVKELDEIGRRLRQEAALVLQAHPRRAIFG